MRIQNDELWDELWCAISEKRDAYERSCFDAPTDEIVDQVMEILARRGLTGRPPRQ